ncbi:winged helix-turn-helix transcriptional regulator [Chitinophaga vietnamensis]|uniref:winged helix-turn-helix transcriptional regulator n=1 Tax=Chitinophaga vietnamensis TaxID=2593957 RepID=UPI0011775EA9|nr:helix-turn-helix domain-containing protein [Chitinophaga vietnamensis]
MQIKNDNAHAQTKCKTELIALRDSLDVLGGKWKLRIMLYLALRTTEQHHFKKILREIEGLSAKMLSKELRELESNLLITRTQQADGSVEYAITDYGHSVIPVMNTLIQWGLHHREVVKSSIIHHS